MNKKYDFGGWATKNDLKCSDGRTIRKDAFKENDGHVCPLVWQHQHNDPSNVLGHALLENREEGVYAYCTFNDSSSGQNAKELVKHGDISSLSIFANSLKQSGGDVLHGIIREVSLVLAGANPGAYIDDVSFAHSDNGNEIDEAVIYTGETIEEAVAHADTEDSGTEDEKNDTSDNNEQKKSDGKTVKEVWDTLTEEQKNVVYFMIGTALDNAESDDKKDTGNDEEDKEVKHNLFDTNTAPAGAYLSHDAMKQIFNDAKRLGSLKEAVEQNMEEGGALAHAIDTTGMTVSTGNQEYFVNDPSFLFPEAKALNNPPEWIKRETDWVADVMRGVHHTPFSRIKSVYANITADEARAKGYLKGHLKKDEVFSLLKRSTSPQTIYKRQKLDRDDILDIADFDVVAWIKSEMRVMLDEEIARAILIGDGRLPSDDDKISDDHVRPILTDKPLFTIQATAVKEASDELTAKNIIKAAIRARKDYKGSGNPVFFTTEDVLTSMLLIEDEMGHFMYKSAAELATVMRVGKIVTVPVMEGLKNSSDKDVFGIIVNLSDYNVGADKGGEVNMFDDFDIDYNQQKYLIETRISGALIKPFSAIVLSEA